MNRRGLGREGVNIGMRREGRGWNRRGRRTEGKG